VFTTLNMVALAPMLSANVSTATVVNPGLRRKARIAKPTACGQESITLRRDRDPFAGILNREGGAWARAFLPRAAM
jgi:hypothetical protein